MLRVLILSSVIITTIVSGMEPDRRESMQCQPARREALDWNMDSSSYQLAQFMVKKWISTLGAEQQTSLSWPCATGNYTPFAYNPFDTTQANNPNPQRILQWLYSAHLAPKFTKESIEDYRLVCTERCWTLSLLLSDTVETYKCFNYHLRKNYSGFRFIAQRPRTPDETVMKWVAINCHGKEEYSDTIYDQ